MPNYWIKRGDQIKGPFSGTNIRSLVDLGQVQPTDEISPNQTGPWQPLSKVPALSAKIKTETISMQTSISLPPAQSAPPMVTQPQPQYIAAPPMMQQPHYSAPMQHPQYAAPAAPQIVYVQVPQAAQPVQIVNNVTSSNVNQNRNTAIAVGVSGNSGVTFALLCFIGAVVCVATEYYGVAVAVGALGILASLAGVVISFTMWGRGLAASLVLLLLNGATLGIASSKQNAQTTKPTQTASIGVVDRCC